jgi:hypothetical protein
MHLIALLGQLVLNIDQPTIEPALITDGIASRVGCHEGQNQRCQFRVFFGGDPPTTRRTLAGGGRQGKSGLNVAPPAGDGFAIQASDGEVIYV